jgi:hypothetical protein
LKDSVIYAEDIKIHISVDGTKVPQLVQAASKYTGWRLCPQPLYLYQQTDEATKEIFNKNTNFVVAKELHVRRVLKESTQRLILLEQLPWEC